MHNASALFLDKLSPELRPLVQIIDDWFTNRRLALVFEAKLGECDLIICGSDLHTDLHRRPAARQFRKSLLNYMKSPSFRPRHAITREQLKSI